MNYKNLLMYGGISVVVLILIIILYFWLAAPSQSFQSVENFSGTGSGSGSGSSGETYTLMLFFANWCPHCTAAKPEWETTKSQYAGKSINGHQVNFVEYDCTEPGPDVENIMDKYKVESFPTIILVSPTGTITQMNNKPTNASIVNFLNANVK